MRRLLITLPALFLLVAPVSAHYLWITVQKAGEKQTVDLFFEEGPRPGDGQYLDPFIKRGTTWVRTGTGEAEPVKMAEVKQPGKRWLSTALQSTGPCGITSYGKWGVYRYGELDILLHYYAKHIRVDSAEGLGAFARARELELDLVPSVVGDKVEVLVMWKGKPAVGRTVLVRGPGVRENPKTNEDGVIRFQIDQPGEYALRTSIELKGEKGTFEGKEYAEVRHHSTLTIKLPLGQK